MRPLEGVRELRERRMLSQQELAERAGVSLFTVQRIERGEGSVRPKTGRAIAAALGVSVEDLSGKAEAPREAGPPEAPLVKESAASAHTTSGGTAKPEILYVLRRVAQGEISPEEGAHLIEEISAA